MHCLAQAGETGETASLQPAAVASYLAQQLLGELCNFLLLQLRHPKHPQVRVHLHPQVCEHLSGHPNSFVRMPLKAQLLQEVGHESSSSDSLLLRGGNHQEVVYVR